MISVIIPCYNSRKTIIACIQSVLSQSYRNFEIIIVDDGSEDNTVEVIHEFIENTKPDKHIQIVSQANAGPSLARNRGVQLSKGEWIAFLDSDDEWHQDKLMIQNQVCEENPDVKLIASEHNKVKFGPHVFIKEIKFSDMLFRNFFATSGVLIKSDVMKQFEFDVKQKYSEDFRVWLKVAAIYKCIYVNQVLTYPIEPVYSRSHNGLSSKLWLMEAGELSNFKYLLKHGYIGWPLYVIVVAFSFAKYSIRILSKWMFRK